MSGRSGELYFSCQLSVRADADVTPNSDPTILSVGGLVLTHRQTGVAIHALDAFPIHREPLTPKQSVQAAIAPPWPQERQGGQSLPPRGVARAPRRIALGGASEAREAARLTFRNAGGVHGTGDGRPPLLGRHHFVPNKSFTTCRLSA